MDGRMDRRTDGRTDGWTDGRKFPPVSYRTSALWGRCPKRVLFNPGCRKIAVKAFKHRLFDVPNCQTEGFVGLISLWKIKDRNS